MRDEGCNGLSPEGGTLSYAPEGGKFPLPASFLSCSAARFDSGGGVQQTWLFLCFCYGIPPLLTLCKDWAVMVHVLLLYCLTHCCRDLKKERVRLKCLPRSTGHEQTILKCSVAIVDVILLLVHVASWVLVCDASYILVRCLPLCVDATAMGAVIPNHVERLAFRIPIVSFGCVIALMVYAWKRCWGGLRVGPRKVSAWNFSSTRRVVQTAPRCTGQRFHQHRVTVLCAGQMVFDSRKGCGVVFVRTYCECSSGRSGRVKVCCRSFGHGHRPSAPKNQTYRRCHRVRVGNKTRARQTHLEQVKFLSWLFGMWPHMCLQRTVAILIARAGLGTAPAYWLLSECEIGAQCGFTRDLPEKHNFQVQRGDC